MAHHNVTCINDGSMMLVYAESLGPPSWKRSVLITLLYTELFTADVASRGSCLVSHVPYLMSHVLNLSPIHV